MYLYYTLKYPFKHKKRKDFFNILFYKVKPLISGVWVFYKSIILSIAPVIKDKSMTLKSS